MLAVSVDIETFIVRLAADGIKPSFSVRFFIDQRNCFAEGTVASEKCSACDTVNVRYGLEPLHPTDDLANAHGCAHLDLKSMIHHFPEHARGKPGQAYAPLAIDLLRQPEMRSGVEVTHRQVRHEMRSLVEKGCWLAGVHTATRYRRAKILRKRD